jgi:hypothetical protein
MRGTCSPVAILICEPDLVIVGLSQLAHQGGWDEVGFVLLPIALFAVLLAIANRRATRQLAEEDEPSDDAAPPHDL